MTTAKVNGYKALVVDYGGVLTSPLHEAMAAFADDLGIELQDLIRVALAVYLRDGSVDDEMVVGFETGTVSEEEFSKGLAERLSALTPAPVPPEGLVERLFAGMGLDEEMLALVEQVRASGLKTALLSNSWGLGGYPRDRFAKLFDVVVISGEVGLRKPDRAIYDLTTDRLGIAAEACVFVDDHPGHLKAARQAGMTTVLHRSHDRTRAELTTLLSLNL